MTLPFPLRPDLPPEDATVVLRAGVMGADIGIDDLADAGGPE